GGGTDDKDPGTKDPGITDDEEEIATFTVTFESNGGGSVDALTLEEGSLLTLSYDIVPDPEEGKYFAGWYKDAECSDDQLWDFAYEKVTADVTLYAKWGIIVDTFTWRTGTDDNIIIFSISGSDKVIAIPEEIDNKKVIKFNDDGGGIDANTVISVILPDTFLSAYAGAFRNCSSLTSILVSKNHPNYSTKNGYLCNKAGDTLEVFPLGKKDLSDLPDSITTIQDYTFSQYNSLTSISIPQSITTMGNNVFYNCTNLESVILPDSVTAIGEGAFEKCTSLTSVTLPASLDVIPLGAFTNCSSLTSLTTSDSITVSDSFTIPDTVTAIGLYAFYKCTGLTSVTIPDSVKEINVSSFQGCTSLSKVYLPASAPDILYFGEIRVDNKAFDDNAPDRTFYVPAGSLADYQNSESWTNYIDSFVELSE
ncbi:MAG: leucine-rich repeat protein, partial [Chitinispirillaceae bacterium]|nr:leucine-rich repeat protein [Chitinispirillaceae bacterium]MBN2769742.1 leucine-rich repeat protein [Spirochaetota bacterium]